MCSKSRSVFLLEKLQNQSLAFLSGKPKNLVATKRVRKMIVAFVNFFVHATIERILVACERVISNQSSHPVTSG